MEFPVLICTGMLTIMVYFLPSFIATMRQHPNLAAIFILNLFLGWSLIGWVVSLAWSVTAIPPNYR